MMADETEHETASEEQAVETTDATDAEHIRERLPEDIRDALTKKAFSPGALRKLIRDTYYMGPMSIGTGGWRGVYGGGQPGTGLRRPNGALYNFPRSWRYAALERALNLGLITDVGGSRFAATERGVAVLHLIDECPDCGEVREPGIYSSVYVGDPNTEGSIESHDLITYCPDCGGDGYGRAGDSTRTSYSEFDREDDHVERAVDAIRNIPEARTYGGEREVRADAAHEQPDVDADATADLLDRVVEEQAEPSPRDVFSGVDECLYGREVVSIPSEGEHYRFKGTAEAVAVSRTDSEGDIHITREGEGRLKVGMDYHTAVEMNAKDAIGHHEDAEWSGEYWTVGADLLGRVVSKLTVGFSEDEHSGVAYFPDSDEDPSGDETWFTVTVSEDAMTEVDSPMVGVEADGSLI